MRDVRRVLESLVSIGCCLALFVGHSGQVKEKVKEAQKNHRLYHCYFWNFAEQYLEKSYFFYQIIHMFNSLEVVN